ncbi:FIG074102: hypothetical protein [plant metagenome]|uniref:Uncharacterized protein n=1 Tax=plant metagenome TaxID=1297885 RepID=A0A484NUI6_9ZZZZ
MAASTQGSANARGLAAMAAVQPRWCAVRPAAQAVGLPARTLLHAGPPYADGASPAAPVLSSMALVCVHEGWAHDAEEGAALVLSGAVRCLPAQDAGVVLPLAAVAGPGTPLVGVADGDTAPTAWSLLGSGAGPQLRFGTRDAAILARLRWRDAVLAPCLDAWVSHAPIDLLPLARAGLANGDDLHASTSAAQAALNAVLPPRLSQAEPGVAAMLSASPLFFLTLWMAACLRMMQAAIDIGDPASTLVVALAGNGRDLGLRLAGQPERWFVSPAPTPAGPRIDPAGTAQAGPLVGDSGVIDAAGFGAQALRHAPAILAALGDWLPEDWHERPARLGQMAHPAFTELGVSVGADAASGAAPLAAIAMVAADGATGLLGRGIVQCSPGIFTQAARSVTDGAA